jgi:hypothetical protein
MFNDCGGDGVIRLGDSFYMLHGDKKHCTKRNACVNNHAARGLLPPFPGAVRIPASNGCMKFPSTAGVWFSLIVP